MGWFAESGWKNIVPDESGTYDRMNPVLQLAIPLLVSKLFEP